MLPTPYRREPEHGGYALRNRVRPRGFSLVELMVVISIMSVLAALLLPALARARELARRQICGNNMKQIFLISRMYADEQSGKFPPGSNNEYFGEFIRLEWQDRQLIRNNFSIETAVLYPDYVEDMRIFVCPSSSAQTADVEAPWFTDMTLVESHLSPILTADPRNVEVLQTITGERIDTECMTSQHYIYLPHAVASEENLLFLFDEYYRLMAIGATQFLWSDLEVPGGHGPGGQDTFFRIFDGVHRMFIENVDRPGLTAVPESEVPLLFDVMSILGTNLPNHVVPMGGNVLYMDGHVDFMRYPDDRLRPPYTEVLVEWLRANTYNNDVLKDVPPWCSNRLPGTEFAPRYLFYPHDPIYQDLYFTF